MENQPAQCYNIVAGFLIVDWSNHEKGRRECMIEKMS